MSVADQAFLEQEEKAIIGSLSDQSDNSASRSHDGRSRTGSHSRSSNPIPQQSGESRSPSLSESPQPPRGYQSREREEKRNELARAERALDRAGAKLFHIRDNYTASLNDFNADVQEGRLRVTKTDFDKHYFLEQKGATRRLAEAEETYAQL